MDPVPASGKKDYPSDVYRTAVSCLHLSFYLFNGWR
jgi:hypothetical protein